MKMNAGLTRRELEYAELMAWGGSTKEVADRLKVSKRTVENTCKIIYRKIGIQKVTELAVWWFCTKLQVPIALDPWKRTIIASILLLIILPKELGFSDDYYRTRRAQARVERITRTRNNKNNELWDPIKLT